MYVPSETVKLDDGTVVTSEERAAQIMEMGQTGSFRILPKPAGGGSKGKERSWEYEAPKANTTPQGMMEYNQDLRIEILEGLEIPPEVVESPSTQGLGSATGRKIPLVAFYSSLAPLSNCLIDDVGEQIIPTLQTVNGIEGDYEISRLIPKSYNGMPTDPMAKTETSTNPAKPNPDRE